MPSEKDPAIQFFLQYEGDKIVKSNETVTHLQSIEKRADNGGFDQIEFSDLCQVVLAKQMPAMICRKFVSCLVPSISVLGKDLADLALWALGDRTHSEKYLVKPLLQIVNLALEYDLVTNRKPLRHIYEVFLSHLEHNVLCETIAAILIKLTSRSEIDARRVQIVKTCSITVGINHNLTSLRWRIRQIRPDLEPNCPPPVAGRSAAQADDILARRFRRIYDSGIDRVLSDMGWEPGQLAGKVVYKDRQKTCLIPSAETIPLESGLKARKSRLVALNTLESVQEALANLESLQLPNNILAVLTCKVATNILPRKELVERFSLVLYHTLHKEFFSEAQKRSKSEMARRQKRQLRLLKILGDFQMVCFNGIPVVGRFLSELLDDWDGQCYFYEILGLLKVVQITEFKEIYDTLLAQVEQHFDSYTLLEKLLVLEAYFELLKYWSAVEYRRLVDQRQGLFPDSTPNCDSPLASIQQLAKHISEISVAAITWARATETRTRLFTDLLTNMFIATQELLVKLRVPVRLELPQPLIYENVFIFSQLGISKVCKYVVSQKQQVLPMLKEIAIHLATIGDEKSARLVRNQLSQDELKPLECTARDILLLLSPTSVSISEDSSLCCDHIDDQFLMNSLFLHRQPAFLSLIIKYFKDMPTQLVQTIFAGLASDRYGCGDADRPAMFAESTAGTNAPSAASRHGRVSSYNFYRGGSGSGGGNSTASGATPTGNWSAISNPDLDSLLNFLMTSLPNVGDFLRLFCLPPKSTTSVYSQNSSSGVSSLEPGSLKTKRLTKKNGPTSGGVSLRTSARRQELELKRRHEESGVSTRHVLTERN